jgi:tetratricopeptide (TPR) repeat protein
MRRIVMVAAVAAAVSVASKAGTAQQGGYREPDCELKTGHFLVNSAVVYIKGASEQGDPVKKQSMLENAQRNLMDAFERGQTENPAVWYFLGRYYVMVNDAMGTDSAFTRAVQLAPQCADDIKFWRNYAWVPVINLAIDSLRAGAYGGAKHLLRAANALYAEDNIGLYYLGRIYASEGELDSAIYYSKRVVELGEPDSSRLENYETAMFNVGLIYTMKASQVEEAALDDSMPAEAAALWDSAAVWFRRYRDHDPSDMQALGQLAAALDRAGHDDQALVLYDSVVTLAPQMDALDLLRTGEALFRAERYEKAADAFRLGLERNRFFRPGLYNLTNTYLALANEDTTQGQSRQRWAAEMEKTARTLVEVDPLSQEALNLLAAAYQIQRKDDSTLAVLERREALSFDVSLEVQQATDDGYLVQGRIVNRQDSTVAVPAIAFEFLDAAGNVVATDTVPAQSLAPNASAPIDLTGIGEGIAAVRYRRAG